MQPQVVGLTLILQQAGLMWQNGTSITWERSGAGPELSRVIFEASTDGVAYTVLDLGTRTSEGWELTGLALPRNENLFIRVKGISRTGKFRGSGSLVESTRLDYLEPFTAYLPLITR